MHVNVKDVVFLEILALRKLTQKKCIKKLIWALEKFTLKNSWNSFILVRPESEI